jgi:hypothetical protein
MRSVVAIISALTLALALGGCQTVDVTKTGKGVYEPTNAADIEILTTKPDRAYVELATVTTTGHSPSDEAKMHNALRDKTAPLGANAVIIISTGIDVHGLLWSRGVAIRWK